MTGLGSRAVFTLTSTDAGYIDLNYLVDHPVWSGAVNNIWDTNTTANWVLAVAGTATTFLPGDAVVFDDTAGTNTTVSISGTADVSPSTVTFNNLNQSYLIQGTHAITGGATLAITGGGAVTIANSNSYTGGTTLFNGLLNLANSAALGSGPLAITGGSLDNTSGTAMTLGGNIAQSWSGSFTFVGSNPLNLGTGPVTVSGSQTVTVNAGTLTVGGAVTNNGAIAVSGAGNLVFAGAISGGSLAMGGSGALTLCPNTFSGGATLNSGVLNINNSSASGSGPFTIAGGTIDNTSGASITLSTSNAENWNANFTFNGTNNLNLGTGPVTLGASTQVTVNGGTLTVGGPISGLGLGLTKSGTGELTLGGSNSYSGPTAVNGGVLNFVGGSIQPATTFSGSGTGRIGAAIASNGTSPTFGSGFTGLLDVEANYSIAALRGATWNSDLGALNVAGGVTFTINGGSGAPAHYHSAV